MATAAHATALANSYRAIAVPTIVFANKQPGKTTYPWSGARLTGHRSTTLAVQQIPRLVDGAEAISYSYDD